MIPGVGPQHPKAAEGTDPRGWLVFEYLPENLQRDEDSRLAADHDWFHAGLNHHLDDQTGTLAPHLARGNTSWRRHATPAERALLEHLGYALPTELWTFVAFRTDNVRRRTWPQIADQVPNPTPEGE